jgi:hypothetical protein
MPNQLFFAVLTGLNALKGNELHTVAETGYRRALVGGMLRGSDEPPDVWKTKICGLFWKKAAVGVPVMKFGSNFANNQNGGPIIKACRGPRPVIYDANFRRCHLENILIFCFASKIPASHASKSGTRHWNNPIKYTGKEVVRTALWQGTASQCNTPALMHLFYFKCQGTYFLINGTPLYSKGIN